MRIRRTVGDAGEDELVRRLTARFPLGEEVIAGPGDDCAVVKGPGRGQLLLMKTDAVVEGVHFDAASPPKLVGRKALARVLSDVAAMGGRPGQALITLVLPPDTELAWVEAVYSGLHALAKRWGVSVVGGETTRGVQKIISVALIGTVRARRWAARSGGKPGDCLLVTGRLGGSLAGRHFTFEPRLEEGRWLVEHFPVHAMMDLSDGLAMDLPRMAAAAGLGYQASMDSLPRHRGVSSSQAWGDGEDYELLLAVAPKFIDRLLSRWSERFPKVPLTPIGKLVPKEESLGGPAGGWDPFKASV